MEPVNTKNRDFNVKQQSHKDLKGSTTYYRIHLNSAHKEAHTQVSDATFDVSGVFPVTGRQDLLDGNWEVFLEEWVAFFSSSIVGNSGIYGTFPRFSMKLCLPDLMLSPQDYTTSAVGKAIRDDSVCHVPLDYKFQGQAYTVPPSFHDVVSTTGSHIFEHGGVMKENQIQVASTTGMKAHMPIYFQGSGVAPGSITYNVQYFIAEVVDGTHFTISTTARGAVMHQTAATATFDVIAGGGNDINVVRNSFNIPTDVLAHVETRWNNVIARDSVGRKIDPHQLLNGKLRVMLRDRDHKTIHTGAVAQHGALTPVDRWQATLLFVHKA